MVIITSTAPDWISFLRISSSEPRASAAEFAMTKPARPLSFSGVIEDLDPEVVGVVRRSASRAGSAGRP